MTPTQFRAALDGLGLSQSEFARIVGVDLRTVQKWVATEGNSARAPNSVAIRVVQWMQQRGRPKEWPTPPS